MNFRPPRAGRRSAPLLDMTPMIDVVFLLLIFFLITTTFIKRDESMVSVNLPTGSSQASGASDNERLTIYVTDDGTYTLGLYGGQAALQVTREQLPGELQTYFDTNPELPIFLRGDRGASYGAIMDVWMLAREIGFVRVNAVVQEPRTPPESP